MNVAGLLLLFAMIIVAVFGGIMIAAQKNTSPYSDSYGAFAGNTSNTSLKQVQNISAVAPSVGTGAALLVGGAILIVILLGLVFAASSRNRFSNNRGM